MTTAVIRMCPSGDPTGNTDQANVATALAALPARGGTLVWGPGTWTFKHPVVRPAGVVIRGYGGAVDNGEADYGTVVKAAPAWSQGPAAIAAMLLHGGDEGGFANLTIQGDGLFAAGVTAHGISGTASLGAVMSRLCVNNVPGNCVDIGAGSGSWYVDHVNALAAGESGFGGIPVDSTFDQCCGAGCTGYGWFGYSPENSKLLGCKAEGNVLHGYHIAGDNGATGGFQMAGCSTDNNAQEGLFITGTGNWPVSITGLALRRDGQNGVSPALTVAAGCTMPVVIDGLTVYPAYGSSTQGPAAGLNIGAGVTYVSVSNAMVHAVTTPVTGTLTRGRAIAVRTGNWNSPGPVTLVADTA